jgi:hypothetical protein
MWYFEIIRNPTLDNTIVEIILNHTSIGRQIRQEILVYRLKCVGGRGRGGAPKSICAPVVNSKIAKSFLNVIGSLLYNS